MDARTPATGGPQGPHDRDQIEYWGRGRANQWHKLSAAAYAVILLQMHNDPKSPDLAGVTIARINN